MYGHHYGDIILKQVADRLHTIFIEDAIVARYGGDEFIVIIEKPTDAEMVKLLAQETIDKISKEYLVENKKFKIGVSIGAVTYPKDASNKYELLHLADKSMYTSKDRGRNRFYIYGEVIE
jgi:diguanylate cyclase (GGDEF)-like protein